MKKYIISCLWVASFVIGSSAKEEGENKKYPILNPKPHSLYQISAVYILWKKRVWREMNLNEKQNRPFFVRGKEITKVVIEGAKKGILVPYKDDKFLETMSQDEFLQKLMIPGSQPNQINHFNKKDNKDNNLQDVGMSKNGKIITKINQKVTAQHHSMMVQKHPNKNITNKKRSSPKLLSPEMEKKNKLKLGDEFFSHQISILRIMEDVLFDKRRSAKVYDIQSIQLIVPGKELPTGIDREIAVFKYKDLIDYLNQLPKEEVAWVNTKNNIENLTWQDAFAKRLFSSRVFKITNLDDATLDEIYNTSPGDRKGLEASQREEEKLVEEECFMFEY